MFRWKESGRDLLSVLYLDSTQTPAVFAVSGFVDVETVIRHSLLDHRLSRLANQ